MVDLRVVIRVKCGVWSNIFRLYKLRVGSAPKAWHSRYICMSWFASALCSTYFFLGWLRLSTLITSPGSMLEASSWHSSTFVRGCGMLRWVVAPDACMTLSEFVLDAAVWLNTICGVFFTFAFVYHCVAILCVSEQVNRRGIHQGEYRYSTILCFIKV